MPIRRVCHLDLGITRVSQGVVGDWLDVFRVQDVLACVAVVVPLVLEEWVDHGGSLFVDFVGTTSQEEGGGTGDDHANN